MPNSETKKHLKDWNINTILIVLGMSITLGGAAAVLNGELKETRVEVIGIKEKVEAHVTLPGHVEGRITLGTMNVKLDLILEKQGEFSTRLSVIELHHPRDE